MPTYEYRCRSCGEHLEVVQSFRDDPLSECGLCGGDLRKVFSATGIIFKGSGYYVNDSRAAARSKDSREGGGTKDGKESKESKEKEAGSAERPDKTGKKEPAAKGSSSPKESSSSSSSDSASASASA